MSGHLDSSILVAALADTEPHHEECLELLRRGDGHVLAHALAETFTTLTGGRQQHRVRPSIAAEAIEITIVRHVHLVSLSASEVLTAIKTAESRGVRGGAIYDYLHLVAARKARATKLYTLNVSDFQHFHRAGDPEIVHP